MFRLATPWVLYLLPLPLLTWWLLPRAKRLPSVALKIPFYEQWQKFTNAHHFSWLGWPLFFACFTWCLLVFAVSGPEWLGQPTPTELRGRDIMMAVDLSGSMKATDMEWHGHVVSRLTVIKMVGAQFIRDRVGDRIGLILFGSKAYLQTPLTFDRTTVAQMLEDATVGLAGQQTAIGDTIGLAIKQLINFPAEDRILVLLTDGASNAGQVSPLAAAEKARQAGVKIYTIGLGGGTMMVNTLLGPQLMTGTSDLDEETLQKIASMTGGSYFRAKNTEDLHQIYQALNRIEPLSHDTFQYRVIIQLYPWPLAVALLLSICVCLPTLRRGWLGGRRT